MKSVAMINTKYWVNAWSVMRTANGFGFDYVYLVDLRMGKPPKMNIRKIDMKRPPHDMFKLITMDQFMNDVLPNYDAVSMELTDNAENMIDFSWGINPLIILGQEDGNVPDEILAKTRQVKIPMKGHVRCFNVACAGSIAMWDVVSKQ